MTKSWPSLKEKLLLNPEVKQEYDALGPEFALRAKIIEHRIKYGLTQAELAKRIGTKQSAISRFERGDYNPTIQFLNKLASGLGVKIKISVS